MTKIMIPIFLAGLALIFTGCASTFVNKREDGLLTTEGSAIDSKEDALAMAMERVSDYCEDKGGYTVFNLPQFVQKTIPIYDDDCEALTGHPMHAISGFYGHQNFPIRHESVLSNLMDEKHQHNCASRFSYDATKWTVKLTFRCNE